MIISNQLGPESCDAHEDYYEEGNAKENCSEAGEAKGHTITYLMTEQS